MSSTTQNSDEILATWNLLLHDLFKRATHSLIRVGGACRICVVLRAFPPLGNRLRLIVIITGLVFKSDII